MVVGASGFMLLRLSVESGRAAGFLSAVSWSRVSFRDLGGSF